MRSVEAAKVLRSSTKTSAGVLVLIASLVCATGAAADGVRFLGRGERPANLPNERLAQDGVFATGKGSVYRHHGFKTQRFKSVTRVLDVWSDIAVFVPALVQERMREHLMIHNVGTTASLRMLTDGTFGAVVKDRETRKIFPDRCRRYQYFFKAREGMHPVELWHKDPDTGVYACHIGHAVTKVAPWEDRFRFGVVPKGGLRAREVRDSL